MILASSAAPSMSGTGIWGIFVLSPTPDGSGAGCACLRSRSVVNCARIVIIVAGVTTRGLMRIPASALAAASAVATSLLTMTPAHAAAAKPAAVADPTTYSCQHVVATRSIPAFVIGHDCIAPGGTPQGQARIIDAQSGPAWICRDSDASGFPDVVRGVECYPEWPTG